MAQEQWQINWADYYGLLGLSFGASEKEVREAYLYKARLLHPDRSAGLPPEVRERAERELARVNEAYGVLREPERRSAYDRAWRAGNGFAPANDDPGPAAFCPSATSGSRPGSSRPAWQAEGVQMLMTILTVTTLVFIATRVIGMAPMGYSRIVVVVALAMVALWLYRRLRR